LRLSLSFCAWLPNTPQALSPVGRCKSFDASGDGYGRGEGFAAALLTQARPGQLALAVVRASAVNQDGQSSGLTAPNGPSQTKLVLNALRQGGLAAAALRFVAVHGTGTPLGDPIEVGALGQAVRSIQHSSGSSAAAAAMPLVLGSVKSCYGHTEGAAGLTGLLLAAQAAGQQCAAPVMHLSSMNPYVEAALGDWQKSSGLAAAIPRQQQAAPHAASLAGTSSFGMSGVNAHVIVAAPSEQELRSEPAGSAGSTGKQLLCSQRLWPLHQVHPMLLSALALPQQAAMFSCSLSRPALSYLWQQQTMGRSVLPATAILELLAAANGCLSNDAPAAPAVADATLAAPVHCEQAAMLTCSIQLSSGAVQLEAGGQLSATARLMWAASASHAVAAPAPASHAVSKLLAARLAAAVPQQGSSMASVAAPAGLPTHGYCCHPALTQATISLDPLAQAVLGCQLYLPAAMAASINSIAAAATASSSSLALVGSTGAAACQLQGLLARPLAAVLAERVATAPHSPAWQLMWQPAEFAPAQQPKASIIISTQPWPLSMLCSVAASEGSELPLVALNAVGSINAGAASSAADPAQPFPELSFSTEAHLELLLRASEAQHCLFVQPPGAPVNTAAALATYRAVARSAEEPRLSLVTYSQHAVGSFAASVDPSVALLQGRLLASWRCCARVAGPATPLHPAGAGLVEPALIETTAEHFCALCLLCWCRPGSDSVHGASLQARAQHRPAGGCPTAPGCHAGSHSGLPRRVWRSGAGR
jgi:hypothetical protein